MKIIEFFKLWKEGIRAITPLQTIKINLIGIAFVFTGIIMGLIITFIYKMWWVFFILCGSFILTLTNFISMLQKYFVYKEMDIKIKIQDLLSKEEVKKNEQESRS